MVTIEQQPFRPPHLCNPTLRHVTCNGRLNCKPPLRRGQHGMSDPPDDRLEYTNVYRSRQQTSRCDQMASAVLTYSGNDRKSRAAAA